MIRHRANKSGPAPQSCPLEASLKLLAGAWTPKILWYLRSEPRRFGDLKRDLGSISAKVLTTRLRELEKRGVLTRTVMPTSPPPWNMPSPHWGTRWAQYWIQSRMSVKRSPKKNL